MGVGLYVVKEIMLLHGGEVEVASTEGEGSSFTICLPRLEGELVAVQASANANRLDERA
jgi:signal transduction histidine kinase